MADCARRDLLYRRASPQQSERIVVRGQVSHQGGGAPGASEARQRFFKQCRLARSGTGHQADNAHPSFFEAFAELASEQIVLLQYALTYFDDARPSAHGSISNYMVLMRTYRRMALKFIAAPTANSASTAPPMMVHFEFIRLSPLPRFQLSKTGSLQSPDLQLERLGDSNRCALPPAARRFPARSPRFGCFSALLPSSALRRERAWDSSRELLMLEFGVSGHQVRVRRHRWFLELFREAWHR